MNSEYTPEEAAFIERARHLAEEVLAPEAETTDRMPSPHRAHFKTLANAGLAGISLPKAWGGSDLSSRAQREVIEALAGGCGVTCFTLMQHHGSSRMIANSGAEALKNRVLRNLASGKNFCAVAFAHLRRPGPPVLAATPVEGGFRLNGIAPWVTGWGLMNQVVVGATLPDGRHAYLWSPQSPKEFADLFADCAPPDGDWGGQTASAPLPLLAMNASSTVQLTFRSYFVPAAHFLHNSDRETMERNDRNGVLGPTAAPLGCARTALRLLEKTAQKRNLAAIQAASAALRTEYETLKSALSDQLQLPSENEIFSRSLALRAQVILLANRSALALCTASSGAANNLSHPAQRLLREAMFYSVQAQTQDVLSATLDGLLTLA